MSVRLASVPHTGTLFLHRLMRIDGHRHFPDQEIERWREAGDKIVIPLRDPVLALVSTLNRGQKDDIAALFNLIARDYAPLPNVHFFRVDAPRGTENERLRALEQFTGVIYGGVDIDWTPLNESGDPLGLKRPYGEGEMPAPLPAFVDRLTDDVCDLLAVHGYDLPWLRERLDRNADRIPH